jgi:hypothetical protein
MMIKTIPSIAWNPAVLSEWMPMLITAVAGVLCAGDRR